MSFSKSFPGLQVRADLGGGSCPASRLSYFFVFFLYIFLSFILFIYSFYCSFYGPLLYCYFFSFPLSLFISRSFSSMTNSSYKSFYILCFHIYGCMLTTGNSINSRIKTFQYDCLIERIALIRLHISSNIM